jgi:DTW domain-containing protein YfiP
MLPSKTQLQLLPRAKVSGKVRNVGKLVAHTHTHTHVFIVKSCSLHYGVTDLVHRPDVYHGRILVDNSLLCTSENL